MRALAVMALQAKALAFPERLKCCVAQRPERPGLCYYAERSRPGLTRSIATAYCTGWWW